MQPAAWPEPDPQIAAAIAAMYGSRKMERPLAVQIRDRLGEWLADEEFAAAFGDRGRPGWSPSRLALVTILQRAEKLTDRLAADAARTRIDWKYLLELPLGDPGFDHTVLAEFRARVADWRRSALAMAERMTLRRWREICVGSERFTGLNQRSAQVTPTFVVPGRRSALAPRGKSV